MSSHGSGRGRGLGGKREDLGGKYFRSSWEANYARYLNWLQQQGQIVSWEYEVDTFEFEGLRRGNSFYTPDFKITDQNGNVEYHEVKGWMDPRSATKLKRMGKYYPTIKVVLIDAPAYKALAADVRRLIPGWESAADGRS